MNSKDWVKKTIEQMKALEIFQDAFMPEIEAASLILQARDDAYDEYVRSGSLPAIIHTLDRGEQNLKRNPLLDAWLQLDKQALSHWQQLGLTVDSLKKINNDAMAKEKTSALSDALKALSDEKTGKKTLERNKKVRGGNRQRKEKSRSGTKTGSKKVSK